MSRNVFVFFLIIVACAGCGPVVGDVISTLKPSVEPGGKFKAVEGQFDVPTQCPDGNGNKKYSIDNKLEVGQRCLGSTTFLNKSKGFSYVKNQRTEIINIHEDGNGFTARFSGKYGASNFAGKRVCKLSGQGSTSILDCEVTEATANYNSVLARIQRKRDDNTCYLQAGGSSIEDNTEFGTYQFANGFVVNAKRFAQTLRGDIFCSRNGGHMVRLGPGTQVSIVIESLDLPNLKSGGCNGEVLGEIYKYRELRRTNGEFVDFSVFEKEEALM